MKPPMKNKNDSFEDEEDFDLFLLSFINEDYEFKSSNEDPDIWDGFSYPDEEYFLPEEPKNVQDPQITFNQRTS